MFLENTRSEIEKNYEERRSLIEKAQAGLHEKMEHLNEKDPDVALSMKYLYSVMSAGDWESYSFETFLDYAIVSVEEYKKHHYTTYMPEEIFLNYVLNHRINNEEITPCRSFFRQELKDVVQHKSMKEDIIAVNYWCASHVCYKSTDNRTASPIAVYNSGIGRCGEESTFTVSVLRSVGIPARQVYSPWWAHCDDNHAWVEVWCDGQWYYMGACEPEEVLNKGWFNSAASRAVLVTSKVYGFINGDEDVISTQEGSFVVNHISRYADTRKISICALDETMTPVPGVRLKLQIINYSSYGTLIEGVTDSEGRFSIETGKGSFHIWAIGDSMLGEAYVGPDECGDIIVHMKKDIEGVVKDKGWNERRYIAPPETNHNQCILSDSQKNAGREKLKEAQGMRHEKEELFNTHGDNVYIVKSRGNWEEIKKILDHDYQSPKMEHYKNKLLECLPEKDLRDISFYTFDSFLRAAMPYSEDFDEELFASCVLNPRVYNEVLCDHREYVNQYFDENQRNGFRGEPRLIWDWIQDNIKSIKKYERINCFASVKGMLNGGIGDHMSKKILFVSICRALGIPARLNPVDGKMEYYKDGKFNMIESSSIRGARLTFSIDDDTACPEYSHDWCLEQLLSGDFVPMDLYGEKWDDHKISIPVTEGTYRVITSNRLPNGNIFAMERYIKIENNENKEVRLTWSKARIDDMVSRMEIPEFNIWNMDGRKQSACEALSQKNTLMVLLNTGAEPTEHILNELCDRAKDIMASEMGVVLVIGSKEEAANPTLKKAMAAIPKADLYIGNYAEDYESIARAAFTDPEKLPLALIVDKNLVCSYATAGYNVGTVDLVLKIAAVL